MAVGPLDVAMFTETFVPHANGVTTSILNARRGLAERGHQVTVYSAGPPVLQNESVRYYGGKTFPLYPDFPIAIFPNKTARDNRRALAVQDPDVVHIHAPGPMGLRGYRAAKRLAKPFLVTYHTVTEPLVRYAPFGMKTVYRVGSTAVDHVLNSACTILLAPSKQAKERLIAREPAWEDKIRIVPTGIDLTRFRPDLDASRVRTQWGFTSGQRVVLYVGRTAYEKKIQVLIEAVERLSRSNEDLRLVIAGTGPAEHQLHDYVSRRRLDHLVHFAGHVPDQDLPAVYNACDVFASASDFETQGLTLLEAMASGAPAAVAGAGGYLNFVRDGHNAYLFPPDSVDGAAHGIELALNAPPGLRQRARESAMEWGISNCSRLLEAAYREAVETHRVVA